MKLDKDFSSSDDAQDTVDESPTPAVLGPDSKIYVVDDHHTLSALDFSGYDDTQVTINILCDKRGMNAHEFWDELQKQNLAYMAAHPAGDPNGLPVAINYTQLPQTFSFTKDSMTMTDDPWRSIAGFSRKVTEAAPPAPECAEDKYCERCMYRGCVDGYQSSGEGVPFFEFRWSYFMNDATYYNTQLWPTEESLQSFKIIYEKLEYPSVVGSVDTDKWFEVANQVISLCRGDAAADYKVNPILYSNINSLELPGYFDGYIQLSPDPDCAAPKCY